MADATSVDLADDELDRQLVGSRIRARRQELNLTLQNVADRTSLSKSFLSQVEIGRTWPSVQALERISEVLQTPVRVFVAEGNDGPGAAPYRRPVSDPTPDSHPDPVVRVVRGDERKQVVYPGREPLDLLTPDLGRAMEVTMTADDPGAWHTVPRREPEAEEFALVLSGTYEVETGGEVHTVGAGDSIYFSPEEVYRLRAIGAEPAEAIWISTPPGF